ncbi:T9SS type A sorting domain-containing protein [Nonlabens ponticola]|nr:YCF48-related protein [Nonlabens ponticola]
MKQLLLLGLSLILSIPAGAQFWVERDSDFTVPSSGISRFSIVDENVVWGIGYDGLNPNNNVQRFSKSEDGGETWDSGQFVLGEVGLGISDISALSATMCYVAAYPRDSDHQGGLWQTVDGGDSWTMLTTTQFSNSNSFPNVVHFFNDNEGIVIGDPINNQWELYTTQDGGATFTAISPANIPAPQAGETGYLAQKTFSGDSIWFTTSNGRLFHSTDKGMNWQVYDTPVSDFGGVDINADVSFGNPTRGILQTNDGTLYGTNDAGATWQLIVISGTGNPYGDNIAYVPGTNSIVSVGSDPDFSGSSYSRDNGVTWTNINTRQYVDVAFFNETTGYSGGFTSDQLTGGVFDYTGSVLTVDDSAFAKAVSLYPNPTNDVLSIQTDAPLDRIVVRSLTGIILKEASGNTQRLSLQDVASGLYLVTLYSASDTYTQTIIKN